MMSWYDCVTQYMILIACATSTRLPWASPSVPRKKKSRANQLQSIGFFILFLCWIALIKLVQRSESSLTRNAEMNNGTTIKKDKLECIWIRSVETYSYEEKVNISAVFKLEK